MAAADIAKLFDLSGQVACLTGGAGGMGRSTGIVLAQAGAAVILADVNEAGLEETARFIEDAGGKASTVRCDVTNEAAVEALVAKAVTDHGRIDIMGNIAGIFQQSLIVDTTEQMMDDLFAINLKGVFFGVKHALKAMIPQKRGNIVNVSSGIIDFTGTASSALYGMSKAAVAMLGKTAAAEGAPHGVRVNTIAPGVVITGFSEHNWRDAEGREIPGRREAYIQAAEEYTPLGLVGHPDHVAHAILYLVSQTGDFVTGQIIRPNGGLQMPW